MIVDEEKKVSHRQYRGVTAAIISIVAVTFTAYHILYITGLIARVGIFMNIPQHLAIHVGLILVLVFLLLPLGTKASRVKLPWYDVVLLVVGLAWNLYIVINFNAIHARGVIASLRTEEVIGSWLNMLVILEATRRLMGWAIPAIGAFFLLYALFADYFPGFLAAPGHDWLRVGRSVGMFVTGMYGDLLNISATVMVAFILFAQFLVITGAGQWFINIAQALLGHVRGGAAKVAVVASSLMGTISGSSVANVAAVGVFTIPLMKATGYRAHFAGGVEAAASNGGQIMPPVMGIAAFMMIDFLQIPYSRIILAGILPALAYYGALFIMADCEAAKTGLRGVPRNQLPDLKKTIIDGWQYILPIATLIFLLMFFGYSAELSGLYATGVMVVIGLVNRGNRLTLRKIYRAFRGTAIDMMLVAITLSVAGIIVGCIQLSGLSYRLSMGLVTVAGGNVWLLLVLTAISCLILGMGMTTSAVYVIMATLVAPALVTVGFTPIASHFFVFYYGVAALITPPVCPASYVAAGIAGASPMRTGITATRLAIITFMAPFVFIFQPAFLMEGTTTETVLATGYVFIATIVLAGGLSGYMFGNANLWWRILFIGLVLVIIYPTPLTNTLGSILAGAALLVKFLVSRFARQPQTVAASKTQ